MKFCRLLGWSQIPIWIVEGSSSVPMNVSCRLRISVIFKSGVAAQAYAPPVLEDVKYNEYSDPSWIGSVADEDVECASVFGNAADEPKTSAVQQLGITPEPSFSKSA